jgi:hypothetical protein
MQKLSQKSKSINRTFRQTQGEVAKDDRKVLKEQNNCILALCTSHTLPSLLLKWSIETASAKTILNKN